MLTVVAGLMPSYLSFAVLLVALVYVPLTIFFANLFERRGSLGLVLRQEYGAAGSTTLYAFAAASLAALPLAYLDQYAGLSASVREALMAFVSREMPEALVRRRTQIVDEAQSATGSASTESRERSVASTARAFAPGSPNSRAGMCRPKQVSVCAPAARSSGPRIVGSVSEWQ